MNVVIGNVMYLTHSFPNTLAPPEIPTAPFLDQTHGGKFQAPQKKVFGPQWVGCIEYPEADQARRLGFFFHRPMSAK